MKFKVIMTFDGALRTAEFDGKPALDIGLKDLQANRLVADYKVYQVNETEIDSYERPETDADAKEEVG